MKKLLGVSIAAMLAVSPMMANATSASAGEIGSVTATANTDIATTSYVAGAYNAIATEHNKVVADIAVADGNYTDDANSIGTNVKALDTAIGIQAADGQNIKASATKNIAENVAILDTGMGKVADLSKDITGTAFGANTVLNGYSGSLVGAVQKIAAAVDTANTGNSTKNTVATDGYYIEAGDGVASNLEDLDTAVRTNYVAIDAILNSTIPLYGTWNSGDSTGSVAIRSLQGSTNGFPKEPAAPDTRTPGQVDG